MYIDPGFGAIIIQVVVGSIVAIFAVVKMFGARIKNAFKRKQLQRPTE